VSALRSGFVTLAGRPNVGKSALLNRLVGTKVSIVSDKPQTTRREVRGILSVPAAGDRPEAQVVLVDTPGVHKPRTAMGERANAAAAAALAEVDLACLVLDATAPVGAGDRFVAARLPPGSLCVLNKVDRASPATVAERLAAAAGLELAEYLPVSARTGEGTEALVEAIVTRLPEGPRWYPEGTVGDTGEDTWVAELVREQLLARLHQELPHSVATRVVDRDEPPGAPGPRVKVEILVERESQKGIVIGRGGSVLRAVGSAARAQLPPGTHLELVVRVERDWQRRPGVLDRLGL